MDVKDCSSMAELAVVMDNIVIKHESDPEYAIEVEHARYWLNRTKNDMLHIRTPYTTPDFAHWLETYINGLILAVVYHRISPKFSNDDEEFLNHLAWLGKKVVGKFPQYQRP